jgi:hypothetical protein
MSFDRMSGFLRILNNSPLLGIASFTFRPDGPTRAVGEALARRMGVQVDDAAIRILLDTWAVLMATACGNADQMAMAAYMNYPPADLAPQYQDQFTYGFTPAYSFGYNSAEYLPVSGATANPTLWTPAAAAATFVPATTSPLTQNKNGNELNGVSSSTSTSSSLPVQQDPALIAQHMNDLQQQISPVYSAPHNSYKQHYHQMSGGHQHHYRNSYNNDYMGRQAPPLPLQYYRYNKQNGYYDEFGSSFGFDSQNGKQNSYKTNRSSKNKYNGSSNSKPSYTAGSNDGNEFKNSSQNEFVNTDLMVGGNEQSSAALSKSDSKTWASIVGYQNGSQVQQQPQPNKSTSPSNSAVSSSSNQQQQEQQTEFQAQQTQSYNNSNNNYKNAYPSRNKPFKKYQKQSFNNNNNNNNQEAQQQYVEFNLNNGAFPPISINCKF